jgi:hypothetical protein
LEVLVVFFADEYGVEQLNIPLALQIEIECIDGMDIADGQDKTVDSGNHVQYNRVVAFLSWRRYGQGIRQRRNIPL